VRAHTFEAEQVVARPRSEVFEFFAAPENLERITPPWLSFALTGPRPERVREGTEISYRLHVHGAPIKWTSRIDAYEADSMFIDRQLTGPYRLWLHRHLFVPDGDQATIVRDRVTYQLPLGIAGAIAHVAFVRRDLERIFAYRREAIDQLFGDTR
jgi:ligand-binding SRPBCC domain-containing protein